MDDSQTFLDTLRLTLAQVGAYNSLNEIPPVAVLWPDGARAWESLTPLLRLRMPLLTLGPYAPEAATGPGTWLRCMLARALAGSPPADRTPVVYLPGVSAAQLRSADRLPRDLTLLAELRYRSAIWSHHDGADWMPLEFLTGKRLRPDPPGSFSLAAIMWKYPEISLPPWGNPDVEARLDMETEQALRRALPIVATMTLAQLRSDAPWKAKDFDALVSAPEQRITKLIAGGEGARLEFKATARWDIKNNCRSAEIEMVIVKTVAAFLNSYEGGTLLIGVNDDRSIRGLADDYQVWSKPEERDCDSYELWLMNLLTLKLGKQFGSFIKITFPQVDGVEICEVTVAPGPEPAYFIEPNKKSGQPEERFYIRIGNQSLPVQTMSEAVKYSKQRWG